MAVRALMPAVPLANTNPFTSGLALAHSTDKGCFGDTHLHLQVAPPRIGGGFSIFAWRTSIAATLPAPRGYAPGARPATSVVTYGQPGSPGHSRNRLKTFSRLVEAFERDEIEAGVDLLIAALDSRDGDPDLEPNGDERDAGIPEGWRGIASFDPAQLTHEDAEDDDSDRCAAYDDHGGDSVKCMDHSLALPGDPDDAEDDEDDRFLTVADGWDDQWCIFSAGVHHTAGARQ